MKEIVEFYRGAKELYDPVLHKDGIYFAVDKKQIIMNGVSYGFDVTDTEINLISKVEFVSPDTLKFIASNGNETIIVFPVATTTNAGLMSAADKEALDKIPEVYVTKEDIGDQFVPWVQESGNKVIILPKNSKLSGTVVQEDGTEDNIDLIKLNISEDVQQVGVGSSKMNLNLNSKDRPKVELPQREKEDIAYLSDLSWVEVTQ